MSYSDSLIYGVSWRETKGKPQKWFIMRIIFIVLLRIHLQQKKKFGCLPIYKALPQYIIYPSAFCS